jgi:hypothetical protein
LSRLAPAARRLPARRSLTHRRTLGPAPTVKSQALMQTRQKAATRPQKKGAGDVAVSNPHAFAGRFLTQQSSPGVHFWQSLSLRGDLEGGQNGQQGPTRQSRRVPFNSANRRLIDRRDGGQQLPGPIVDSNLTILRMVCACTSPDADSGLRYLFGIR